MKIRISIILLILHSTSQIFSQDISIDEKKYVTIGGIEQWITIKGDHMNNPAILFIHGGPGSVMSPFADNIYGE